jgi:hypothetical protein
MGLKIQAVIEFIFIRRFASQALIPPFLLATRILPGLAWLASVWSLQISGLH